jgi:hypothetical protein
MPPLPTPEAWAKIRHEYENTRRSIEDICLAYGVSANTLRRRVKLWGWTMRRPPIIDEGPAACAEPDIFAEEDAPTPTLPRNGGGGNFNAESPPQIGEPSPHIVEPSGPRAASEHLQAAVGRVMRAIETTSVRLTARSVHLRETEMAARALGSLTRTLGELNELLAEHKALEPKQSVDELRRSVARKLEALVAEQTRPPPGDADEASPEAAPASI